MRMTDNQNNPERNVTLPHDGAITSAVDAVSIDQAKPKVGRPKLSTGTAKGRVVNVRFTSEEIERITASAKASNKTISEWIRSTLNAAIEG
jgi:predicted HicB family RNase H-like nuclease